ncbi:MAG: type II toxin-antitoxin system VapC family toxin [Microgenomates group bacterium]
MSKYLVDTNIIIDFSRKDRKAAAFLESLEEIIVSIVTVGEIYQGVGNKRELESAKQFFRNTKILLIDEQISTLALELLEKYTLPSGLLILDALIAATAIKFDLILVTSNVKHFKIIEGLKLKNW